MTDVESRKKNKIRAKLMAIENQGITASNCQTLDEAWFMWWQGLSESGWSESECEDIMEKEVAGFFRDLEHGLYDVAIIKDVDDKLEALYAFKNS